jgi:type I restriction enzyme S subunit
MRANPDFCEEDFLHHIIANERFISYVMSGAKGVKMPRGDKEQMKEYKTALPSKKEQLPISLLLSLLDEHIISQSRAIEDLKRLRLAFQDKLIEQLVCSNDLKSFSEVYEVAGEGGTPDTSKREYYDGGTIPFIKIDDLANKYLKKHKDSITELGMQKSSAWLVPANSLIFSNGATIGAASINSYPVATKQGILGIVPKNNISVEYLYYLMTSTYFKKQVHRIITHGTMATAYLKDINKISVPIPSFDKQEYVSLVLSSLSGKEAIETQMLSQLQNQKQYLLQRMFI